MKFDYNLCGVCHTKLEERFSKYPTIYYKYCPECGRDDNANMQTKKPSKLWEFFLFIPPCLPLVYCCYWNLLHN